MIQIVYCEDREQYMISYRDTDEMIQGQAEEDIFIWEECHRKGRIWYNSYIEAIKTAIQIYEDLQ